MIGMLCFTLVFLFIDNVYQCGHVSNNVIVVH